MSLQGVCVTTRGIVVYSDFNTDYGSSEPLKTLVMLCYVIINVLQMVESASLLKMRVVLMAE